MQRGGYFSGLGCLSALIVLLLLSLIIWFQGGPLLASPGPLSAVTPQATPLQGFQSHADFENNCGQCHAPLWSRERMADRCLACHTPVAEAIARSEGLHGRLRDPRRCTACHVEHQGRDARLTRLDLAGFPHETDVVGFTLVSHRTDFDKTPLDCQRCHTDTLSSFDQALCVECHTVGQRAFTDQHRADAGDDCLACHDGSGQLANFDHDQMTGFSLTGEHRQAACQDCHVENKFRGLETTCVSCHLEDDEHAGQYGTTCESCHTPADWDRSTFQHDLTDFTFEGRPLNIATSCATCHHQDDEHAGKYGTACESCHTPADWDRATFRHDLADFAFEGRPLDIATNCVTCHLQDDEHAGKYGTACESCHTPEDWRRVTFRHDQVVFVVEGRPLDIATNCVTCHSRDDEHSGSFGTQCQTCHVPEAWGKVTFDHDQTDFPLTGKHVQVECKACHVEEEFVSLDTLCVACHLQDDAHDGQYGTSCERCHVAAAWDQATFDHTIPGLMYGGQPLDIATGCATCHLKDDAHDGEFGDACYECHVPDAWDQVTFDHALTRFPLDGAHRAVTCEKCHVGRRFAGTPTDCAACHPEPQIHAGLLSTQCAECHTVDAWKPAFLPEHTFPLNHRSRSNIACDVCHDQGTFQTYTCYNCHEHGPAKVEREHREEGIRDFQDCMRCHPTGREHEGEGREHEGEGREGDD